jgi:primosomal protein N' (replication factor Y)
VAGDPSIVTEGERSRREMLSLPPFGALARVSGPGSDEFVEHLETTGLDVGHGAEHHLVRADDWMELGRRLNAAPRPSGSKIRIEVDPPRA